MAKEKIKPKQFVTDSNIPVEPIYNQSKNSKESPGKYPFTRGIHSGMYRDRLWTMRQYSGFGDAAQSNKRYKFMLDSGQTGLSMALICLHKLVMILIQHVLKVRLVKLVYQLRH